MRTIPVSTKHHIEVRDDGPIELKTNSGEPWTSGDSMISHILLLSRFVKMFDLLNAVNEATGPGACEQQLPDAIRDVHEYLNKLPK
jgi:hypothetical protein